jgi:hypothetical protein
MPDTIPIPVDALLPALLPDFERLTNAWLSQQPAPDPQYTIEQAASLLGVSTDTVADYLRLPASHPRRLCYVVTHDSARGRRIPLSALHDWQQRNGCDALAQAAQAEAKPKRRPARRTSK